MAEPVPEKLISSPGPLDNKLPGGSLDLENVNPLQQAILQRVRDAETRGRWLPKMSVAQWIVSAVIAVVLVAGIFNVVDAGLTAFQRFAEVSLSGSSLPPKPAVEPSPVDVTQPLTVIIVPDDAPPAAPTPTASPQ